MKSAFCTLVFVVLAIATTHAQNTFPPSGNVGIGTTSPSFPLSAVGTVQFNGSTNQAIAYTKISWNAVAGTGASTFDNHRDLGNTAFVFRTTTSTNPFTELMRIDGSGNVGIGNTSPASKLDVTGQVSIGSGSVNTNNTKLFIRNPAGKTWAVSSGLNLVNETDFGIYNWTDNATTPLVNISSTGNVGIGTTNTGSFKLAVEGKLGARKIIVTQTSPWPDYVFDSSYDLKTISEIEQFIKTNKHLPEVPSAAEAKKDGTDLGDSQVTLLKKIEELTLYLIEQNKKIEALQQLVSEQGRMTLYMIDQKKEINTLRKELIQPKHNFKK